jgi:hypothetical protein
MCQINFTITANSGDSNTVSSAQGRYKLTTEATSVSTWISPFFISDISNSQTPDITTEGNYDFDVRVLDSNGDYSEWFVVSQGFQIGNCEPTSILCSQYGVNYNNYSPGTTNKFEAGISIEPSAQDYEFVLSFTATRTDITETTTQTINISVLSGDSDGTADMDTPDSGNQNENWVIDTWEIVSYSPNDGAFTIETNCQPTIQTFNALLEPTEPLSSSGACGDPSGFNHLIQPNSMDGSNLVHKRNGDVFRGGGKWYTPNITTASSSDGAVIYNFPKADFVVKVNDGGTVVQTEPCQ